MSKRLPSFRSPRDLTLGGKADASKGGLKTPKSLLGDADKKKKFAPNLNVQRKDVKLKLDDTKSSKSPNEASTSGWKKSSKPSTAKTKSKPELIQVSGMFADGVGSEGEAKKGWARKDSERESKAIERPKIDFNVKYDKAAEEKKLKALLRDDFIDDLKTGHLVPVQLPMTDTGKVFKEEASEETDEDIKRTGKKKKNVILDSDDDDDEISPSIATEKNVSNIEKKDAKPEDLTFAHLINSQRSEILFFQLPDHLPSRSTTKSKDETGDEKVTLNKLSEGYLGKLQLRQSGKVQLLVNDVLFEIDVGTQVGFLQELYSVDTNGSHGNMTNLGRVRNRVIAMPAWQELFNATKVEKDTSDSSDDDSS